MKRKNPFLKTNRKPKARWLKSLTRKMNKMKSADWKRIAKEFQEMEFEGPTVKEFFEKDYIL
jgi:hypothetical protein